MVDRYQIIEDLREWLKEQHDIITEGYHGPGKWITAYSCTLEKLEQLEQEHE